MTASPTGSAAAPARRGGGLYLHLPFCSAICPYCHFARTAEHDAALRRRVTAAIAGEFVLRRARCATLREGRAELRTLYVGGGTPSRLEPELLAALLAATAGRLPAAADLEATAEANPESFTPAVAAAWRDLGLNRVSLGVQSLDDRVLRWLGRRADAAASRAALALAVDRFPRVSADWIVAPGVRPARLAAELREAVARGVEHVSLYILELHAGTALAAAVAAGRRRAPAEGPTADAWLAGAAALESAGLRQYEVANFARPGGESRHNRAYWSGVPYLGLGPGAHGFWGRRRYANLGDVRQYADAVEAGRLPEETVDPLDRAQRGLERAILSLRTTAGLPLAQVPAGLLPLAAGEAVGLWRVVEGRLRLTPRGFLRLDSLEELLARALLAPPRPPVRPG
ncbi:MAG: coproporphyrinogen-III oxidase family protein [Candidatus Krumholzibacteriia bacterium]